jgi:HSP20 family protein
MRSLIPWRSSNWLERRPALFSDEPLTSLQRAMNRAIDDFIEDFSSPARSLLRPDGEFSPRIDVRESDKHVQITAEVPGIAEKDMHVSLDDENHLTIRGEKKLEKEGGDSDRWYVERSYGSFSRTLRLPAAVKPEKCEAVYKDGLLKITLPKSKEAAPAGKEIPIAH